MKNLILLLGFTLGVLLFTSCSKGTPFKEDIETGLLCDIEYEFKYSEWCIDNGFKYHIGYPNITCFDSMLISFPVINFGINQYGNYPIRSLYLTQTYFNSLGIYRIDNFDCTEGDNKLKYQMFVEEEELLDPSSVDVLFYFYPESGGFPTDSLLVEFKPWNN